MRTTFPREFYIVKGAVRVTDKAKLGEVYVYTSAAGRPCAQAFTGKQSKATWHHSFKTAAQRDNSVREFFANLAAHQARKAEYRKKRSQPHTLKLGAIIVNSWGYDQTNVDWYAVVGVSTHFVSLRRIARVQTTSEGCGPMSAHCAPSIDVSSPDPAKWGVSFTSDKVTRHKASHNGECNSVRMDHGVGSEWNGKPMYESWYA